ncbi:hypothetical protein ACHAXR_002278 [Thalassiosira sp. AJA248-18]
MVTVHADEHVLAALSDDVGGLWCRNVAVLESPPDAITFLQDFVRPNVPCIIKNAIPSSGATCPLTLNLDEIIDHVGEDATITVDVTPDGHGDCIRRVSEANNDDSKQGQLRMFVKPNEKRMGIGKFRDILRRGQGGNNCDKINADKAVNTPKNDYLEIFPLNRHHSNYADEVHSSEGEGMFLDGARNPPVVYYSRQNDCLRTEVAKLFSTQLFPDTFPFAEQAFGTGPPDAVNLWIGNEKSVSSMHKDHYENLFYVCSGQKEFILCPPADVVFLHEGEFSSGTFCPVRDNASRGESDEQTHLASHWTVVADDGNEGGLDETSEVKTRWIEPDIKKHMENPSTSEFPLLSKAHPIKVLVSEGEMLYIPSLWFHRVTQTCETVGVNYWFDMKFDSPHWCYFNFLQRMKGESRELNPS